MTKKTFNQLLRYRPELGQRPNGIGGFFTFARYDASLKPINLGRRALTHREKMDVKKKERDLGK